MDVRFCDNCNKNIPQISWILHEATCKRHHWYCKKCEKVIPVTDRDLHEEQVHSLITCQCGEELEISLLEMHKITDCVKRLISCDYCKCPVPFKNLIEHEDVCGSRTEECEYCSKRVQLRYLLTHDCQNISDEIIDSNNNQALPIDQNDNDLIVCPFCLEPSENYVSLQEHIFSRHSKNI